MNVWVTLGLVVLMRVLVSLFRSWLATYMSKDSESQIASAKAEARAVRPLHNPPLEIDNETVARLEKKWDTAIHSIPATGKNYLVIGTGFLGSRIVDALVKRGETNVRAFDMVLPPMQSRTPGVQWVQGNVCDAQAVRNACRGIDVVYSTFAVIRYWEAQPHQLSASTSVNVDGTNIVVEACLQENVKELISTSTSNVCVTKSPEMQYFDEDTPYVNSNTAPHHYAYSKMLAEILVLNANGKPCDNGELLHTACARPCSGIFGARDRFCVQRFLDLGRYDIVVEGLLDWVYVDNIVWGHLVLERALNLNPIKIGGKAICYSNNESMTVVDMLSHVKHHRPALQFKRLPRPIILGLASFFDMLRSLLKDRFPDKGDLQLLTSASFIAAGLNYILKSDRAEKWTDYRPVFTVEEGILLSVVEYDRLKAKSTANAQLANSVA